MYKCSLLTRFLLTILVFSKPSNVSTFRYEILFGEVNIYKKNKRNALLNLHGENLTSFSRASFVCIITQMSVVNMIYVGMMPCRLIV